MNKIKKITTDPDWVDPVNDRKTPFTDEELEMFVEDFIANMGDVQAWQNLIQDVGETKARQILKKRIAARDGKNLINWNPDPAALLN